jgi:hypothetical protein
MEAIARLGDETTYRQSAAFRQFHSGLRPGIDLYGWSKGGIVFRVCPSVPILRTSLPWA